MRAQEAHYSFINMDCSSSYYVPGTVLSAASSQEMEDNTSLTFWSFACYYSGET